MRILFIGDIVGTPGVGIVKKLVPELIVREQLDLVIANAENAAGGSGLTPALYRQLREAGVDAVTMGDHIYKRMELTKLLTPEEPICKPANFPEEAPGRTHVVVQARDGTAVGLISVLGRLYTRPVDCPFKAVDAELKLLDGKARCVVVDMHAEATGERSWAGISMAG